MAGSVEYLCTSAATIDLGELREGTAAEPRQLPDRLRRGLFALVVALFGVAGSATGEPDLAEPLWTATMGLSGFNLGSRNLYVVEPGGQAIVARDLLTGEPRWRRDAVGELQLPTEEVGVGVAAMYTHRERFDGENLGWEDRTVTLVAESTGTLLGTATGYALGPTTVGGRLLVASGRDRRTDSCPVGAEQCLDLSAVDIATGAQAWRLSLPAGATTSESYADNTIESFVAVDRSGAVRIYAAATGAVIDTLVLSPEDVAPQSLLLQDALILTRRVGDQVVVDAYRRAPLRRAWSLTVSPARPPVQYLSWFNVNPCGDLLCLHVDGGSVLIDRASGQVRVRTGLQVVSRLGEGALLAYSSSVRSDRYLDSVMFLDATDGTAVASFPEAAIVSWVDDDAYALLAREGTARTAFIIVDERGRSRVLGSVSGTGLHCMARRQVLACADAAWVLRVWQLPARRP